MSFDRRQARPYDEEATSGPLVEACYVPQRYEPNYPYPLLVMLHARGGRRAADGPVGLGDELAELRRA